MTSSRNTPPPPPPPKGARRRIFVDRKTGRKYIEDPATGRKIPYQPAGQQPQGAPQPQGTPQAQGTPQSQGTPQPQAAPRPQQPHPQLPGVSRAAANLAVDSPAEALVPQRPPELPPQDDEEENDRPFLRIFDGLLNFVLIVACMAAAFFYFLRVEFDRPGPLQVSTIFAVPKGASTTSIANRLTQEGVITDRRIFMAAIFSSCRRETSR